MIEIVKEFKTSDGIGAMLWKKIYAMSYAKHNNKLFQNTPFDWFLIHESDNVNDETKFQKMLDDFNGLLIDPWKDIDFDSLENTVLCPHAGLGAPRPGMTDHNDFLVCAPDFNSLAGISYNSVVIHIRRGNAIPENPRFVEDDFYINLLKNMPGIIEELGLDNPDVIICTDATNAPKSYVPIDERQQHMWHQPHLYKDSSGGYPTTTLDFDALRSAYPGVKIANSLDTFSSFKLMLTAKLLVVGQSAFSQSAGLLSTNMVIGMPPKYGMSPDFNYFRNLVGSLDSSGNFNKLVRE